MFVDVRGVPGVRTMGTTEKDVNVQITWKPIVDQRRIRSGIRRKSSGRIVGDNRARFRIFSRSVPRTLFRIKGNAGGSIFLGNSIIISQGEDYLGSRILAKIMRHIYSGSAVSHIRRCDITKVPRSNSGQAISEAITEADSEKSYVVDRKRIFT